MQVSSISSVNQSFKGSISKEIFSALSDDDLKVLAYKKASDDVNDKKHNRIDKALFLSSPVIGGLAAAAESSGRFNRGLGFIAGFTSWAVPLLATVIANKAQYKVEDNVKPAHNFSKNHPVLSYFTTIAGAILLTVGSFKGIDKLVSKYGPKLLEKEIPVLDKLVVAIEKSKLLDNLSLQINKIPSAAKSIIKSTLNFGPFAVLGAAFVHRLNHNAIKNQEAYYNYAMLKEIQKDIAEDVIDD